MKRGRVVTWKDRRGTGKLQEERIVSGRPGGDSVSSSSSRPNASVSKWSTPSKDVRGGASKEWTQGVSGETAQLLQVLLGVQPSVPAGRLGERDGVGSNDAEQTGAGRGEMRRTWHAILAVEEEEASGKRGRGGGSEVLTSDDEGEPVHSAACLLEDEEEDASPSHPYPQWQITLLSPAVEEVRGLRRLMLGGAQPEACKWTRVCGCRLRQILAAEMLAYISPSDESTLIYPRVDTWRPQSESKGRILAHDHHTHLSDHHTHLNIIHWFH
jgi:hypothetical protein